MTELVKIKEPKGLGLTLASNPDRISARPFFWRRLWGRYCDIRAAWITRRALERLDDHLLRDIGVEPAERALYRPGKPLLGDCWISRF